MLSVAAGSPKVAPTSSVAKPAALEGADTQKGANTIEWTGSQSFQIKDGQFILNGKPSLILAGEMHPARIPREYWKQRIDMAKAMGMNTIAAYVFWNYQNPEPGVYDWKGMHDIAGFVRLCGQEGMKVLLRPGPYCCAEWEFGGFPYWLLNIPGLKLRTDNPQYLKQTGIYLDALGKQLAPLQATKGGPIIMVQVENEYGSFGSSLPYMEAVKKQLIHAGFDVPFFQADGGSQLANDYVPGLVAGVNGAGGPDMKATVDKYTPGGPYICTEFYPGWLDHWGENFVHTGGGIKEFHDLVTNGCSVSMYMIHGGTNFAFYNGSNWDGHLQPSITSYDYDAPISEAGHPTKKFFEYRKIVEEATGKTLPPVPPTPAVQSVKSFTLNQAGSYLHAIPQKQVGFYSEPPTFEAIGQAYGYVLYRHQVTGAVDSEVKLPNLRDFAVVMLDGKTIAVLDSRKDQDTFQLKTGPNGGLLDILVANLGRINYGGKIGDNWHGLLGGVKMDGQDVKDWHVFGLPLNTVKGLKLDGDKTSGPTFYRGSFETSSKADTFLDMRNFTKGVVFVNGHNLGRYWRIGPQQTLYCPGCWLKDGKNEVVVFELQGTSNPSITGLDAPILDQLEK